MLAFDSASSTRRDCSAPSSLATPLSSQGGGARPFLEGAPAGVIVETSAPLTSAFPTGAISDFDVVPDRSGTASLKWDFAAERGRPAEAIPLWVADMDHQTAPAITSALLWRVRHGIFGYTDPDAQYLQALTAWFARRYEWAVQPEWNTVTAGVVPALALAVRAVSEPGDVILIEEPVYYPFREVIEDNGRRVASAPLLQTAEGGYVRDLASLERAARRSGAKALLLCNPHNPVGRVWSREELESLADLAERLDLTIISDEIHADLALPGYRTTPFASLSLQASARTITCTSPSKSFNLAGLQVANILIENPELRAAFRRELAATGYSQPNALGLTACEAAYTKADAWLDALREHIAEAREHVIARLAQIPGITVTPGEGTYLLWLDCRGFLDAAGLDYASLDEVMLEGGLWLDDGAIFGAGGQGFTRINVACPRLTLDAALDRLATAVTGILREAQESQHNQEARFAAKAA